MKNQLIIVSLCFFFSFQLIAQEKKVAIYGNVSVEDKSFNPISWFGISYHVTELNGEGYLTSAMVDSLGNFRFEISKISKIKLHPHYSKYFSKDTTIRSLSLHEIKVNFVLKKKTYFYTALQAEKDIQNNKVNVIEWDSTLYLLNKKHNFSKQFGFEYQVVQRPHDSDSLYQMGEYMEKIDSLLEQKNEDFYDKLVNTIDSLRYLESDNYTAKNSIDLAKLLVPSGEKMSRKMKEKIESQKKRFHRLWSNSKGDYNRILNFSPTFILNEIDNNDDYQYLFEANYWVVYNYEKIVKELIKRVSNKKFIGLKNTADLIIYERNQAGFLKSYGHGGVVRDDLFTIAGRANHFLKIISGEDDFKSVSMYSTDEDLKKLQNRWLYWLLQLQ